MTSSNTGSAITPRLIEARTIAFEVLAEHNPDPWAPAEVTPEVVAEARRRIRHLYADSNGLYSMLRKWLSNPGKFDPHVDEVAVEKAMALDFEAYTNLTDVEADIVRSRLAEMSDPWGWGVDMSSDDPRNWNPRGNRPPSPRAEVWLRWPKREREKLQYVVTKRRGRARAAVAAAA